MTEKLTRLNKYLSEAGICSRRAADKLIEEGRLPLPKEFDRSKHIIVPLYQSE